MPSASVAAYEGANGRSPALCWKRDDVAMEMMMALMTRSCGRWGARAAAALNSDSKREDAFYLEKFNSDGASTSCRGLQAANQPPPPPAR